MTISHLKTHKLFQFLHIFYDIFDNNDLCHANSLVLTWKQVVLYHFNGDVNTFTAALWVENMALIRLFPKKQQISLFTQ